MRNRPDDLMAALLAAAILDSKNEKEEPKTEPDMRKASKKLGEMMRESMLGFMDAGFTEEQAFQIALTIKKGN